MSHTPDDQGRSLPEAGHPKPPAKPKVTQAQPAFESDSAIDLGSETGEGVSLSGVSVIEWASLLEEAPSPAPSPDAPALVPQPADPTVPVAGSDDIFDAVMDLDSAPVFPPSAEDSAIGLDDDAIDLGEDAVMVEEALDSGEVIDLGADAVVDGPPSGIDLTDAALVEEVPDAVLAEDDDSGIDLFGGAGSDGPASMLSSRVVDSGIDLVPEDLVSDPASKAKLAGKDSGRDLIAEGLESGVDLGGPKSSVPAGLPSVGSEDALDDFLSQVNNEDPSSSVDLGSMHSIPTIDLGELAGTPAPSSVEVSEDVLLETVDEMPAVDPDAMSFEATEDGIDLAGLETVEAQEETAPKKTMTARKGKAEAAALEEAAEEPAPVAKKKGRRDDDEERVPEKKAKPEKKPGKAGAWIGGTVLGAVLATAACAGVWMAGLLDAKTASSPGTRPGGVQAPPPAVQPAGVVAAERLRAGEIDKITDADLAKLDAAAPGELALRAEVRWLRYLKEKRGKNLKAGDVPVQQALADLDEAVKKGSADALFQRGQIHEMVGDAAKARADFEKGLKEAKDAADKERFQAGLDGLPAKVAMGMPAANGLAVLLVLGFQPKDAPAPLEAAPKLAQAIKLAGQGKYKEAIEAVEEARKRHDARRFLFPNQPLNPRSDPRQKSFLAACDEIAKRYKMLMALSDPGYLTAKERVPLVAALVDKAEETARAALLKEAAQKLVGDKPAATVKELAKLIGAERKSAADKARDLEGKLADSTKAITGLEAKLKETVALLETTKKDLLAAGERNEALAASNGAVLAALKAVGAAVKVRVGGAEDAPALVKEVRESVRIAAMKDAPGTIRKLEGELARDRARLAQRWRPAQMLAAWLPIVARDRDRADLGSRALKDVARVEADPEATPEQKEQAAAIAGLVLRNRGRLDEAKEALAKAAPLGEPWKSAVASALREASDPTAGAAEKAEALAAAGKTREALALFARALAAPGSDKGALHARRGLVALEDALSRGAARLDDPAILAAKKDAEAAIKAGAAEGHYLAGRLAEQAGDLGAAEKAYRAALAGHKALDEAGTRYRAALAQVLLRLGEGGGKAPRPLPSPRLGKAPALGQMLAASLLALALPGDKADVTEAERLAREILAAGDKVPFPARAQALAVQGLHTQALRTYLDGLLAKGLLSPTHANALRALIEEHPTLSRPESKITPDPILGEKAYGKGLNHFFARRYSAAEEAFKDAVKNDNGDARYYYFLGLSRLALGDREGFEDFDQAAALERSGRPDKAAVSKSLERVQGPMRRALNNVRDGAIRDKKK